LHIDAAFQPRRPGTLRCQTESNASSTRLTARSAIRTPFRSSACLYTRFCGSPPPRAFPTSLGNRPKPDPFSEPIAPCVSSRTTCFELARRVLRVALRLAADRERDAYDRLLLPTFSTSSTRASRATGISSRLASRPWSSDLHPGPGDRWIWRFTTPNPLRWALRGWRYGVLFRALPSNRTSDTPVASGALHVALATHILPVCQGRFARLSVKMRRTPRPGEPSIAGGPSRTCVRRGWSPGRSRVFPRGSNPRHRFIRSSSRSACAGLRLLRTRSPSPPIASLHAHHAQRRQTLLWIKCRPTTSATTWMTRGHTLERPILAFLLRSGVLAVNAWSRLRSRRAG